MCIPAVDEMQSDFPRDLRLPRVPPTPPCPPLARGGNVIVRATFNSTYTFARPSSHRLVHLSHALPEVSFRGRADDGASPRRITSASSKLAGPLSRCL